MAHTFANDPDPGSGSKDLSLNRDHFWLDDPVKDLLEQPIIVYEVLWLNLDNDCLYHVHFVLYCIWRKSRSTGSIPFEPEPSSKSRWSWIRIVIEILGHWQHMYTFENIPQKFSLQITQITSRTQNLHILPPGTGVEVQTNKSAATSLHFLVWVFAL